MYMNSAIAAAILAFASRTLAYDPSAYGASSLHARDFSTDFAADYGLYAREADPYASPEAAAFDDDDDFDLFAREAGEPEPQDEKLDLHERDAAAADFDDEAFDFNLQARELDDALDGLHPRDAYLSGYEEGLYAREAAPANPLAPSGSSGTGATSATSAGSSASGGASGVGEKWQIKSLQKKPPKDLFALSEKLAKVQQKYFERQQNLMHAVKYHADHNDPAKKASKKGSAGSAASSGQASGMAGKTQTRR